jgi:hypothetical protein
MATKRKLKVQPRPAQGGEPEPEEDLRTWSKRVLAKYWFVIACLFVDTSVPLDLYGRLDRSIALAIVAVVLLGLLLVEVYVYLRTWGTHGVWRYPEWE